MKSNMASGVVAAAYLLSEVAAAGTLQLGITKNRQVESQQLQKRGGTAATALGNAQGLGLYYANVTVGTPGQPVSLQIDTGSSDVWIPSAKADICATSPGCYGGNFSTGSSSTFKVVGRNQFNISYVDGSGATGDYVTDTFSIGGGSINDFEMGVASKTTIPMGLMGVGYNNSVANVFTGNGTAYANLPDALVNAGLISTQAYSLWLDNLQAASGSVLFGGIDTKRYQGNLSSINVYPSADSGKIDSFTVAFTSLSATSSSGSDLLTPATYATAAILDSGTTLTYLPDPVAALVFAELGAVIDDSLGATLVRCTLAKNTGTLSYGFGGIGGPIIKVPVSELVLPLVLSNGKSVTLSDGSTACQLGIMAAGDLPILFGDTFLRSAYVVYDLANNRVGIAQSDFNSTGSNIVSFASQGAAIPSATTATGEAAVTQTATGIPRVGDTATGTAGGTAAGSAPTSTGLTAQAGFKSNRASSQFGALDLSKVTLMSLCMGLVIVGGGLFTSL